MDRFELPPPAPSLKNKKKSPSVSPRFSGTHTRTRSARQLPAPRGEEMLGEPARAGRPVRPQTMREAARRPRQFDQNALAHLFSPGHNSPIRWEPTRGFYSLLFLLNSLGRRGDHLQIEPGSQEGRRAISRPPPPTALRDPGSSVPLVVWKLLPFVSLERSPDQSP